MLKFIKNIEQSDYATLPKLHHSSTRRGYVSRKALGELYEYNGRFGKGYLVKAARFDSSQYCTYQYYI